jgi:peptidoglycan/LPS O-acetylase OafA/YrhL
MVTATARIIMNMNNQTSPLPDANTKRRPRLSRWLVGILLGFVSLFLMFFLGESFGEPAMYIGVGAFALCAQLFLSRGHVAALRKDWPVILCLNFMLLLSMVLCFTLEHNNPGAHLTALVMVGVGVACSYAGAGLAAGIARNRTPAV